MGPGLYPLGALGFRQRGLLHPLSYGQPQLHPPILRTTCVIESFPSFSYSDICDPFLLLISLLQVII